MTRTRRPLALFLMLSSLHWLGNSLASNPPDLSHSEASSDEVPAVISRDAPITNLSKRPVLQPKETAPLQSTYTLRTPQGRVCVRASLGVEYVVTENKTEKRQKMYFCPMGMKDYNSQNASLPCEAITNTTNLITKKYYFNMNPSSTRTTGYCGDQRSVLSLEFDGGNLQFIFIKEGVFSYVKTIKGLLMPAPPCKNCQSKSYSGIMDNEKLFKAKKGLSFQCMSETDLNLASSLRVKLVPLQIQAFDLDGGVFGKEVECWADYNKRMIPIILGGVTAAICLIAILTCVLVREHRGRGYEQL